MKRKQLTSSFLLMTTIYVGLNSRAEETLTEKTKVVATQAVDGVKAGIEEVRNKACELVNGKLTCAVKKIKRKLKN